jgi:hypothetical protein
MVSAMAGILHTLWKVIRNSEAKNHPQLKPEEAAQVASEERRVVERYRGPLPATISAGLSSFPEPVIVRDLNEKGVYLYSSSAFPRGATVEILAELPPELSLYGKRRVHYTASVVRCEENVEEGKYGIAAVIKKCEVLPARETSEAVGASAETVPDTAKTNRNGEKPEISRPLRAKNSAHVRE